MLVYLWGKRNPGMQISLLGLLAFNAPYLAWVLLGFSLLLGHDVSSDLLGIVRARRARVGWDFWRAAYPNAKVRRFQRARLHGMVDPFIALAPDIQVRAKGVVVRLGFGALVHQ